MCQCDFSGRLYAPACDSLYITAHWFHLGRDWTLTVNHHHSGESMAAETDRYANLSTDELFDCIDGVTGHLLVRSAWPAACGTSPLCGPLDD